MPSKSLSEFAAKSLFYGKSKSQLLGFKRNITSVTDLINFYGENAKLVAKIDQQIKGRMKLGLVKLGLTPIEVVEWISTLDSSYQNFLVEPIVHNIDAEIYVSVRNSDINTEICLIETGGIDVGHLDEADQTDVPRLIVANGEKFDSSKLTPNIKLQFALNQLYEFYKSKHLTFLEVNPLALANDSYIPLDMLAKYDDCATYVLDEFDRQILNSDEDNSVKITPEESYISELAQKTGSSLQFKLLNPNSRVWFILFGGGASVCFLDKWMKICEGRPDLQPANYGEMSGNPSREFVFEYMKQILSLIKNSESEFPFYIVIGGGIANFTLVDKTFAGIIDAIKLNSPMLRQKQVRIFVRRGGPNYEIGLDQLTKCCAANSIFCNCNGPEKSMTSILDEIAELEGINKTIQVYKPFDVETQPISYHLRTFYQFTSDSECFIFGAQLDVAQNMLDYDFYTGRAKPSVRAFIDPSRRSVSNTQVFWGTTKSIILPIYPDIETAIKAHPNVEILLNFASFRTAFSSSKTAFLTDQIKFVSILAEGIAENQTKELIYLANKLGKTILGPSTIGALYPGKFRLGNAGGKLDLLMKSGLHKIGSVGIVTRSGGLLNELCSIASKSGFGVAAATAIGGDRFTGTKFSDVVYSYEHDQTVKLIVMLGEIGSVQELEVAEMVRTGIITKPIIGLCLGSSADKFDKSIQFGHAGADAQSKLERATFKNSYMAGAGIKVPESWEQIEQLVKLIGNNLQLPTQTFESDAKPVMNFDSALSQGLVRKHSNFVTSISSEQSTELVYNGKPVSTIKSVGQAIGLLWFKRDIPDFLSEYIELILITCADHGASVSGAQNTIVSTRAGKDLVSSLCSGLLTIGPKFGGAIGESAKIFYYAYKNSISASDLIRQTKIISGIGHKYYTKFNPDKRVGMLETFITDKLDRTDIIEYAKSVETLTLQKKSNLILNVDGFIAASLLDGFISAGFTDTELVEILENDILNAFFLLARSIGFIGHHIDQKRLKQDLYRAPSYDVSYIGL